MPRSAPTAPTDHLPSGSHVEPTRYVPLTVAAERVSLCDRTIRRAISAGDLRAYKIGKALRVRVDELDRWVESKAIPNARTVNKPVSVR